MQAHLHFKKVALIASLLIIGVLSTLCVCYFLPIGFSAPELHVLRCRANYGIVSGVLESIQLSQGLRGSKAEHRRLYLFRAPYVGQAPSDVVVIGPVYPPQLIDSEDFKHNSALTPGGVVIPEGGDATVDFDGTGNLILLSSTSGAHVTVNTLELEESQKHASWSSPGRRWSRDALPGLPLGGRAKSASRRFILQFEPGSTGNEYSDDDVPFGKSVEGNPSNGRPRLYDLNLGRIQPDPWLESVFKRFGGSRGVYGAYNFLTEDLAFYILFPEGGGQFAFKGNTYEASEYCLVFVRGADEPVLTRKAPNGFSFAISISGDLYLLGSEGGKVILLRRDGKAKVTGVELPEWCYSNWYNAAQINRSLDTLSYVDSSDTKSLVRVFWWNFKTGQSGIWSGTPGDKFHIRWNQYVPKDPISITK